MDVAAVLDPPLPITEKPENKVVTLDKIEQELNNVSFFRILFFFVFSFFFLKLSINFAKHVRIWLARSSGADAGGLSLMSFSLLQ